MRVYFDGYEWCAEDESLPGIKVVAPTETEAREHFILLKDVKRIVASSKVTL